MVHCPCSKKPLVISQHRRNSAEEDSMLTGRVYEMMQNELDGDFSKMHVKVKFQIPTP